MGAGLWPSVWVPCGVALCGLIQALDGESRNPALVNFPAEGGLSLPKTARSPRSSTTLKSNSLRQETQLFPPAAPAWGHPLKGALCLAEFCTPDPSDGNGPLLGSLNPALSSASSMASSLRISPFTLSFVYLRPRRADPGSFMVVAGQRAWRVQQEPQPEAEPEQLGPVGSVSALPWISWCRRWVPCRLPFTVTSVP